MSADPERPVQRRPNLRILITSVPQQRPYPAQALQVIVMTNHPDLSVLCQRRLDHSLAQMLHRLGLGAVDWTATAVAIGHQEPATRAAPGGAVETRFKQKTADPPLSERGERVGHPAGGPAPAVDALKQTIEHVALF